MAYLRVYAVGEVEWSRPRRQLLQVALRRVHEHLVLEHVRLEGLDELLCPAHVALPFEKLPEPGHLLLELFVRRRTFLVEPVRRDSVLREEVHLVSADLYLHGQGVLAQHGGVQRLVEVVLGIGYVVVELAREGPPPGVDHPQRRIAVLDVADEDPKGEQVVYLVDRLVLGPVRSHLVGDAVEVLRPPLHLTLQPVLLQLGFQDGLDAFHVLFPRLALGADQLRNLHVLVRLEMLVRQVLQEPLDLPYAQPVSQWRVYVEGLLGDDLSPVLAQRLERPHVVEPVRQLDQDDPDVLRHGHQHLSHRSGPDLVVLRTLRALQLGGLG